MCCFRIKKKRKVLANIIMKAEKGRQFIFVFTYGYFDARR